MSILLRLKTWLLGKPKPQHLRTGDIGEKAAKRHLKRKGLKFLMANFRTTRGEIDLVFQEKDCLVFVEVKARTSEEWGRPAAAVDWERRGRLTRAALDYLRKIKNPEVKTRFDIVEVLLEGKDLAEVRHLPNAFEMQRPHRYR